MEFTKIQLTKQNTLNVTYKNADGDVIQFTGANIVHKDLKDAMNALVPHLAIITEQREAYGRTLKDVQADYDFIIIDCPPSLSLLTVNALTAADSVLIPIQCEYYALEGVTSLMNTVNRIKHTVNPHLKVEGILLTMLDGRTNLGLQVVAEVKKHFKQQVFATTIPRNVRLGEAPSHGVPIHMYDARSTGAEAYRALGREVLARNGMKAKK